MPQSTSRVAEDIRRYCAAHPGARDTIEGIVWWVQMEQQADLRRLVSMAVDTLVRHGELERHRLQDGTTVFGCTRCASTSPPPVDSDS